MSQLYIRVRTTFYSNPKTLRLKTRLGSDALWIPPALWAYAAENNPTGTFEGYTAQEIATLIGYAGDASIMLQALLETKFMDSNPLRIHDWEEHNAYHAQFKARAQKAAAARWGNEPPSLYSPSENGKRNRKGNKHCLRNAPSNETQSSGPKLFPREYRDKIEAAQREIDRIRDFGERKDGRLTPPNIDLIKQLKENIKTWTNLYLELKSGVESSQLQ